MLPISWASAYDFHLTETFQRPVEYVSTLLKDNIKVLTMTYRRDKKLFKPATVKTWVIVIYESQGRFRQDTARDMARGFIEGAISVGKCIHYIIFFIAVKLIDSVQV